MAITETLYWKNHWWQTFLNVWENLHIYRQFHTLCLYLLTADIWTVITCHTEWNWKQLSDNTKKLLSDRKYHAFCFAWSQGYSWMKIRNLNMFLCEEGREGKKSLLYFIRLQYYQCKNSCSGEYLLLYLFSLPFSFLNITLISSV